MDGRLFDYSGIKYRRMNRTTNTFVHPRISVTYSLHVPVVLAVLFICHFNQGLYPRSAEDAAGITSEIRPSINVAVTLRERATSSRYRRLKLRGRPGRRSISPSGRRCRARSRARFVLVSYLGVYIHRGGPLIRGPNRSAVTGGRCEGTRPVCSPCARVYLVIQ